MGAIVIEVSKSLCTDERRLNMGERASVICPLVLLKLNLLLESFRGGLDFNSGELSYTAVMLGLFSR